MFIRVSISIRVVSHPSECRSREGDRGRVSEQPLDRPGVWGDGHTDEGDSGQLEAAVQQREREEVGKRGGRRKKG